ncbi:IclR family transcriptional regulator [Pseudonocardia sp. NPDC046786]|uniref:IclR family transcriptional regulator n=1 Tax=Pseudonocardia sp. NPDC046786 TaxID=3155471 RepID=UPI0033DA4352
MALPTTAEGRATRASRKGAQTLARGIEVLEYVAAASRPQRPSEIARALDFDRNAVYRLLQELEAKSYVSRPADSPGYVTGNALVALAATVMRKVDLRSSARPIMESIADQTGETICLFVRSGRDRVCVETVPGRHIDRRVVQIGERLPLYLGPSGKVILSYMEPQDVDSVITQAAEAGLSPEELRATVAQVKANGFLVSVGGWSPGIGGLSAPVFQADGSVAALTISGPAARCDQTTMEQWAETVREACRGLSVSLGYTA